MGQIITGASIIQSYATVSVTAGAYDPIPNINNNGAAGIGSLVGIVFGGTITESFATGLVRGGANSPLGGLIGFEYSPTVVTSSYWDTQSTGKSISAEGVGLTTAQLKAGLPSGFDATVWGINANINTGYPYLLWQVP